MNVHFTNDADKELRDWLKSDRKVAQKIYELIEDIKNNGLNYGKGKPEQFIKTRLGGALLMATGLYIRQSARTIC